MPPRWAHRQGGSAALPPETENHLVPFPLGSLWVQERFIKPKFKKQGMNFHVISNCDSCFPPKVF